jgi:predicted methyltransferase MtxX (methanogen marker protein 4)
MSGQVVYVVCGFQRCGQRLEVDRAVWEAEMARRAALSEGVQVWHARGDRLVPVAPDVDGRVP